MIPGPSETQLNGSKHFFIVQLLDPSPEGIVAAAFNGAKELVKV